MDENEHTNWVAHWWQNKNLMEFIKQQNPPGRYYHLPSSSRITYESELRSPDRVWTEAELLAELEEL